VLPATPASEAAAILSAIERLSASGSTAMADGLELAYREAAKGLGPDAISRVIVLSDGDANVGSTSHAEILDRLSGYVKEGVTLSAIGFGMGNYDDTMMEQLADRGNGNYTYIDDEEQALRVFREQVVGMLQVVAKDVKVQVEMIPETVAGYRLVGYENRAVADEQFRNDRVDGGEIGAGHTVTALYEVELTGATGPIARVRLRAKAANGEAARETEAILDRAALAARFEDASPDLRFATAVMGAAEILRQSPHARGWTLPQVRDIARTAIGDRAERGELVRLIERAIELSQAS
jgi:Ca-activated chloride channel family protein